MMRTIATAVLATLLSLSSPVSGKSPATLSTAPSPELYDYSRSTADNYEQKNARLRREFFSSRAGLDYSYHTRYSLERQATQDDIIRAMLSYEDIQSGEPRPSMFRSLTRGSGPRLAQPQQPWALITAGCMGSGKRHVIRALDLHDVLPLTRFVRVDIDRIRALLPESDGYVLRDRSCAGSSYFVMTQREAGLIAEVVAEEALKRGLNVWVDSSLSDVAWWVEELQRIKRTYPHRLCLLHVLASWESVQARAAKRGAQTGRRIPQDVLRRTFKSVPLAVTQVTSLVDEYVEVDNDARLPKFRTSRDVRALLRVCDEVGGDTGSRFLEAWLPGY